MEGPSQPWSNPLDAREVPDSSAPAFVQWVTRNKLKALVYIWGGGITTCLVSRKVAAGRVGQSKNKGCCASLLKRNTPASWVGGSCCPAQASCCSAVIVLGRQAPINLNIPAEARGAQERIASHWPGIQGAAGHLSTSRTPRLPTWCPAGVPVDSAHPHVPEDYPHAHVRPDLHAGRAGRRGGGGVLHLRAGSQGAGGAAIVQHSCGLTTPVVSTLCAVVAVCSGGLRRAGGRVTTHATCCSAAADCTLLLHSHACWCLLVWLCSVLILGIAIIIL